MDWLTNMSVQSMDSKSAQFSLKVYVTSEINHFDKRLTKVIQKKTCNIRDLSTD